MSTDRTILIVVPNAASAQSLTSALEQEGWRVQAAGDVHAAFQQARQTKPDAMVIRSDAPGGGGLALVQKLRGSAHTALTRVVALLDGSPLEKHEYQRWGVQACLHCPVDDAAVVQALKTPAEPLTTSPNAPAAILENASRRKALERSGLLDSPPEELFDRVTRLAATLLEVPTVLMTIVDNQRQFFKSHVGLPEPVARARETPLSYSFCQWVVADDDALIVADTRQHPLLRLNPSTTEMGVVAYAGVPIRSSDVEPIGSLCAIDSKPRLWSDAELSSLRNAAAVIEGITALREASRLGPICWKESREVAAAGGRAVASGVRLLQDVGSRLSAAQKRELLEIVGTLGSQLESTASRDGGE